jgi:glycoside/pentoside/hexuronide:cation symporter, GPH family
MMPLREGPAAPGEQLGQPGRAADPALPGPLRLASYGFFALPLAFAALPLYVQWPAHAASRWGLSLAVLGALLLAVRLFDAFIDPWIGARVDALFARSWRRGWAAAGVAAILIAGGMSALMFAPQAVASRPTALLGWAAAALVITSLGYSIAMVIHQAWAVRLGGDAVQQARWVGAREALALGGVIVASLLPSLFGWALTVAALALLLLLAWLALGRVPPGSTPDQGPNSSTSGLPVGIAQPSSTRAPPPRRLSPQRSPWQDPGFRRLLCVMMVSGLASAVPASLVVLYVRDLLQAPGAAEGWVLGLYFAAAALGMPLWVRAVGRFGLVRSWLAGMGLSIAAFAGAAALGPGDLHIFAFICVAAGFALGADLVVPPALLAGLIQRRAPGHADASGAAPGVAAGVEGLWFGWWNFASKLTLALAAGLALPLLQGLGYSPGARDAASLSALAFSYALLPCAIKAAAAVLLWMQRDAWPWASLAVRVPRESP